MVLGGHGGDSRQPEVYTSALSCEARPNPPIAFQHLLLLDRAQQDHPRQVASAVVTECAPLAVPLSGTGLGGVYA